MNNLVISVLPVVIIFILFVQGSPIVVDANELSKEDITLGRRKLSSIFHNFASEQARFEEEVTNDELAAIGGLMSSFSNRLKAKFAVNQHTMVAAISFQLPVFNSSYINIFCLVEQTNEKARFGDCKIGRLPVSSSVSLFLIKHSTSLFFSDEVGDTAYQLLSSISLSHDGIRFFAIKQQDFYQQVKQSVDSVSDLVTMSRGLSDNDDLKQQVTEYLTRLENETFATDKLSERIMFVMILASTDTLKNDQPIFYNQAALWSLAIKYGNVQFADFINIDSSRVTSQSLILKGRQDLALHFLYSAVLGQLSYENVTLGIGEFKELIDSGSGGSGFSFADIAADIAGLEFSKYLIESDNTAERSQRLLSKSDDERVFVPAINDLVEGIDYEELVKVIGEKNSENYQQAIERVKQRVMSVRLFNENIDQPITPELYSNKLKGQGDWYRVDTHIHTKYSDGRHTAEEIASKASLFGCDAIALTDHGDFNLKRLFSSEYFLDIDSARRLFPRLNIIEGLEWNLPPYGGREHATVLLPESPDVRDRLIYFRERFDHHWRFTKDMVRANTGLDWLSTNGVYKNIFPVVFYNHPSRKDEYHFENYDDFVSWKSPVFLGFSGAPGHQKIRDDRNGAYNTRFKTKNGLDPIIFPGSTWDKLLASGHRVFAARSASDFHGEGQDYWPCEFSTTHVYAKSNQTNDVLASFHSGNVWAQHGKFIDKLAFSVNFGDDIPAEMGEVVESDLNELIVNIDIQIAPRDWENKAASLDALNLIIVSAYGEYVENVPIKRVGDKVTVSVPLPFSGDFIYVRLQGASFQGGLHDYQFWTNPIGIVSRK